MEWREWRGGSGRVKVDELRVLKEQGRGGEEEGTYILVHTYKRFALWPTPTWPTGETSNINRVLADLERIGAAQCMGSFPLYDIYLEVHMYHRQNTLRRGATCPRINGNFMRRRIQLLLFAHPLPSAHPLPAFIAPTFLC